MKKIFLSLLLGASLCAPAMAQLDADKMVQLGIRGVVNGTWIGNLPTSRADFNANRDNMKLGFSGGVWLRLRMPITGLFIQPELNIAQQNGGYSYNIVPNSNTPAGTPINPPTGSTFNDERSLSLTNLEFPLSLGFRLNLGNVGIRINAGGVLSGILSAKEIYTQRTTTGTQQITELSQEQTIKDQVNAFQAGLQGGLGLDFGTRLSLDLRLQQNLTNLYDQTQSTITRSNVALSDQRVTTGQLVIGFRLL